MIEIEKLGVEALEEELERLRKERHKECAGVVIAWLADEARKKPVPDLADRIEKMTDDIYRMTEMMKIKVVKGELVVRAEGSTEQTLTQLLLGTNWFEPNEDLVAQILSGLFKGRS